MSIISWIIPKVKYGLTDEQIWIDYLADSEVNHTQNSEGTIKGRARAVREILKKYDVLIELDFYRATRLVSKVGKGLELGLAIKSYDIRDVEGLRDLANLDNTEWECISQTVRASQNINTPWFIVEGKFKKRDQSKIPIDDLIKKYKHIIESYVPKKINVPKVSRGNKLLTISLPDLHMGNMSYDNTDSIEKCSERFLSAVSNFIS